MNQIIKAALEAHTSEYSIEALKEDERFEHFINRCVVNKYSLERFDPADIMTGDGEIGLDGIAILLNGHIVTTLSEAKEYYKKNSNVETIFVFIQAKRSSSFNGGEISTFFRGIKHFFEPKEFRPTTNDKIEELIKVKDYIFSETVNQGTKPVLDTYFACCGTWNSDNNLTNCVQTECKYFEDTADYQRVTFIPADNDKIITMYKELRRKISKTILMQKKMPFYSMNGIEEAYFGLVSCKDIVQLLQDDNGDLFTNIFEDINKNKVITLATQVFSYISFFLNEPQSANSRYYGEILNTYKDKLFVDGSLCEPYYISGYALFLVEDAIRRGAISRRWKEYKYHLIYAIRVLIVGNKIFRSNSREMEKNCEVIYSQLKDSVKFKQLLQTACSCFDETVKQLPQVDKSLINRSKIVTDKLTEIVSQYLSDKSNMLFLEKGNVVSCTITAINDYSAIVELRTDDERNRGSIHISRIARRWVEDINNEFKIGQTVQAKILNDNYFETCGQAPTRRSS